MKKRIPKSDNMYRWRCSCERDTPRQVNERVREEAVKLVTEDKVSFQEAQEFLKVSHDTLYKLMKERLPSHKIRRKRVFLKEDPIRSIKEH